MVEKEAGVLSQFPDEDYEAVGAEIVSRKQAWKAEIVVCTVRHVCVCIHSCTEV